MSVCCNPFGCGPVRRKGPLPATRRYASGANQTRQLVRNGAILDRIGLGVGLGAIALTAYMARETSRAFTATQFALFTSLIAVPRTFANASTGFLIEWLGYTEFFLLCTALAVPGMLMLLKAAPWND